LGGINFIVTIKTCDRRHGLFPDAPVLLGDSATAILQVLATPFLAGALTY